MTAQRITLTAIVSTLVFDLAGSTIAHFTHISYGDFSVGTVLIQLALGYFISRSVAGSTALTAIGCAAIVGLADASLGWALSSFIGPGRTEHPLTVSLWVLTAVLVMIGAIFCALLGYFIESKWLFRFR